MPAEWPRARLRECFSLGRSAIVPALFPGEQFEHYSIPAFDDSGGAAIELGASIESNKMLLDRPAVLVSKLNPRKPRVVLVDGPAGRRRCASTEWMVYIPATEAIVLGFYRWYLGHSGFQRALERIASGSTNSHVRVRPPETLGWWIARPPVDEQRCIADILDTVDDAIRQTERVIAKLEQVKSGMLQDLLTRGIDDNGEVRDPERHPEQFKDSPLGRIPKGWVPRRIAEMIELLDHLRVPVNGDERAERPGTVPYYGANGQQGWIDRPIFDEPLILLAEDGGNFEEFATRPIAYRIAGPAWVNNHAHIIRAAQGTEQGFLFWSLVHKDIRRYIAGGTRSKLTQGELLSIELPAPSASEQRRIAERLDQHEAQVRREGEALAKLRATKQALADDLLTGRVRVNPREAVPA
jgi:type I restriction enzyme S subunit